MVPLLFEQTTLAAMVATVYFYYLCTIQVHTKFKEEFMSSCGCNLKFLRDHMQVSGIGLSKQNLLSRICDTTSRLVNPLSPEL